MIIYFISTSERIFFLMYLWKITMCIWIIEWTNLDALLSWIVTYKWHSHTHTHTHTKIKIDMTSMIRRWSEDSFDNNARCVLISISFGWSLKYSSDTSTWFTVKVGRCCRKKGSQISTHGEQRETANSANQAWDHNFWKQTQFVMKPNGTCTKSGLVSCHLNIQSSFLGAQFEFLQSHNKKQTFSSIARFFLHRWQCFWACLRACPVQVQVNRSSTAATLRSFNWRHAEDWPIKCYVIQFSFYFSLPLTNHNLDIQQAIGSLEPFCYPAKGR